MQKIFTLKIAGMAGQGIKSSGILYARFANRSGKHIYNYIEYPSVIRGGHNVMQINISDEEVMGPSSKTDFASVVCDSRFTRSVRFSVFPGITVDTRSGSKKDCFDFSAPPWPTRMLGESMANGSQPQRFICSTI